MYSEAIAEYASLLFKGLESNNSHWFLFICKNYKILGEINDQNSIIVNIDNYVRRLVE